MHKKLLTRLITSAVLGRLLAGNLLLSINAYSSPVASDRSLLITNHQFSLAEVTDTLLEGANDTTSSQNLFDIISTPVLVLIRACSVRFIPCPMTFTWGNYQT